MWRWLAALTVPLVMSAGCGSNLGKIDKGTVPIATPPTVTPGNNLPPLPKQSDGTKPSKGGPGMPKPAPNKK
jgi:hypothetical protein